jgi:hypothetical protein
MAITTKQYILIILLFVLTTSQNQPSELYFIVDNVMNKITVNKNLNINLSNVRQDWRAVNKIPLPVGLKEGDEVSFTVENINPFRLFSNPGRVKIEIRYFNSKGALQRLVSNQESWKCDDEVPTTSGNIPVPTHELMPDNSIAENIYSLDMTKSIVTCSTIIPYEKDDQSDFNLSKAKCVPSNYGLIESSIVRRNFQFDCVLVNHLGIQVQQEDIAKFILMKKFKIEVYDSNDDKNNVSYDVNYEQDLGKLSISITLEKERVGKQSVKKNFESDLYSLIIKLD